MRRLRPALPLAALLPALAACAGFSGVAPSAQRLQPQALDAGAALRAAQAGAAWPQPSWWQAYGDPQLDRLVADTIAGNPGLAAAQARVAQARGLAEVARAGSLPQLDGEAAFLRTYTTHEEATLSPTQAHTYWQGSALLQASYDLDLWGAQRSALEAALDRVQAAAAETQAARLALATAAVQGYAALAGLYAERDVAQADLERRRNILELARRRYAAGLGTRLEINQAATALPEDEAQVERIEQALALRRNQLAALAGRGPGYGEALARPALKPGSAVAVPADLPAALLGRRPDIAAQRWRVEAASSGIAEARARFYPNVNLSAMAGVASLNLTRLFTDSAAIGTIGPAISLPIFEGGRLRGNLRVQAAAYDAAVDGYNAALIGALREVADAVAALRSLARQRERTQAALDLAQAANGQALLGFRGGLTDYLGVLNTQAELLAQQRSLAQIAAAQLQAHAALMDALGGGFDASAERSAGAGQP
ncbi:MAG: efflux transporter outer membrane subunit [Nevskia sp.]|nr:efflux transporter outer membrane subunit [Nevskia sp.]